MTLQQEDQAEPAERLASAGAEPSGEGREPVEPRRRGEREPSGLLRRWTTRRWLAAGMGVALVLLVALSGVAAATFQHASNTSNTLVFRTAPALVAAVQLEAAMINQETGTRGYGLTGQSDFLQPYTLGLSQESAAIAQLKKLTAGDAQQSADLAAVQTRAAAWQQRIAVPIASSPPGAPAPIATTRADEGRALFDLLRVAMSAEQTHLQQATATGTADIVHVRAERNEVFIAIGLTILVLFLLVFEGLRRGVTRPLASLSSDTRRVTAGEFDHPVSPVGPADLRSLAADIEAMRQSLARELADADRARAALDARAGELRRSNQELEQFAYVASHDLQEPLRKVASFCQLLQRRYSGQLDERADQYIGYAVDGAERMQKLITDLLAFSRVGRVHRRHELVDLDECLTQALGNLELAATEAGATVERQPLPQVRGDATQLTLMLQNLLSNAIKFRKPGQAPHIRVTAERGGDTWHLAVADDGIGIEPEYAEKVFLIFQRLHTKDAYPGSGIGLAMCRKIVDFHEGAIDLDPEHRDGTRIAFTLPALDEPEAQRRDVEL